MHIGQICSGLRCRQSSWTFSRRVRARVLHMGQRGRGRLGWSGSPRTRPILTWPCIPCYRAIRAYQQRMNVIADDVIYTWSGW